MRIRVPTLSAASILFVIGVADTTSVAPPWGSHNLDRGRFLSSASVSSWSSTYGGADTKSFSATAPYFGQGGVAFRPLFDAASEGTPLIDISGLVYICIPRERTPAVAQGHVVAFDPSTGDESGELWRFSPGDVLLAGIALWEPGPLSQGSTALMNITSSQSVATDGQASTATDAQFEAARTLFVATAVNSAGLQTVHAVNLDTGLLRWSSVPTARRITLPIQVRSTDGVPIIAAQNVIVALHPATGRVLWTGETRQNQPIRAFSVCSRTGHVVAATGDRLFAFDRHGALVWTVIQAIQVQPPDPSLFVVSPRFSAPNLLVCDLPAMHWASSSTGVTGTAPFTQPLVIGLTVMAYGLADRTNAVVPATLSAWNISAYDISSGRLVWTAPSSALLPALWPSGIHTVSLGLHVPQQATISAPPTLYITALLANSSMVDPVRVQVQAVNTLTGAVMAPSTVAEMASRPPFESVWLAVPVLHAAPEEAVAAMLPPRVNSSSLVGLTLVFRGFNPETFNGPAIITVKALSLLLPRIEDWTRDAAGSAADTVVTLWRREDSERVPCPEDPFVTSFCGETAARLINEWPRQILAVSPTGQLYIQRTRAVHTVQVCPPGWQCTPEGPGPCPAGSFSTGFGSTVCRLCARGSYSDVEGATECKPKACPPGYFCPQGSGAPVPCPESTYSPNWNESSISACTSCAVTAINFRQGCSSLDCCLACGSGRSCPSAPLSGRNAIMGPKTTAVGIQWASVRSGLPYSLAPATAPVVSPAGSVYLPSDDRLAAMTPTSAAMASFALGPVLSSPVFFYTSPIMFVAGEHGAVHAINSASGAFLWTARTPCTAFVGAAPVVLPLGLQVIPDSASSDWGSPVFRDMTGANSIVDLDMQAFDAGADSCTGSGTQTRETILLCEEHHAQAYSLSPGSVLRVLSHSNASLQAGHYLPGLDCHITIEAAAPEHFLSVVVLKARLDKMTFQDGVTQDTKIKSLVPHYGDYFTVADASSNQTLLLLQGDEAGDYRTDGRTLKGQAHLYHTPASSLSMRFLTDVAGEQEGVELLVYAHPRAHILGLKMSAVLVLGCASGSIVSINASNGAQSGYTPERYSTGSGQGAQRGPIASAGSVGYTGITSEPIVFFNDIAGSVFAIRVDTQQHVWVRHSSTSPYTNVTTIPPALAAVASTTDLLDYFDERPDSVRGGLVIAASYGLLYTVTMGGMVQALAVQDGHMVWSTQLPLPIRGKYTYAGSPALTGQDALLIVCDGLGVVHALNSLSGNVSWSTDLTTTAESAREGLSETMYSSLGSLWLPMTPAIDGQGHVYVSTPVGSMYCLEASTGLIRWRILSFLTSTPHSVLLPPSTALFLGTNAIAVSAVPAGMTFMRDQPYSLFSPHVVRPCAWGTFRESDADPTDCTACPAGFYTPSTFTGTPPSPLTDCNQALPCPPGAYCPAGSRSPIPCVPGTYSNTAGSAQCKICSAGTYQHAAGASSCLDCRTGTANPLRGQRSQAACKACPPGTYAVAPGTATCLDCEAGSYNTQPGSTGCDLCPVGTYSNAVGANSSSTCVGCPAGTFAVAGGSSMVACLACGAGFYSNIRAAVGQDSCLPCLKGSISASGSSACTLCPAGTYAGMLASKECIQCPRNTYQPSEGAQNASACRPCPFNTRTTGTGSTASSDCEPVLYTCPDGKQPKVGVTQPRSVQDCDELLCAAAGIMKSPDGKACIGCPPGFLARNISVGFPPCQPCSISGASCVGLLSIPLYNGSFINRTLASLAVASSSSRILADSEPASQRNLYVDEEVTEQELVETGVCPPLRLSTSVDNAQEDSWTAYIIPTIASFGGVATLAVFIFLVGLLIRFCNLRLESRRRRARARAAAYKADAAAAIHDGQVGTVGTPAKKKKAKIRLHKVFVPVTDKVLRSVDAFDMEHDVEEHRSPVRRPTALGGLFTVLAVMAILALSIVLLIQYFNDNTLIQQSLEVPQVDSSGVVVNAQGKDTISAADVFSNGPRGQTNGLIWTGTGSSRLLKGVEFRVVVQGEPGVCAKPLRWGFSGLAAGSFKLRGVKTCTRSAGSSLSLSQLTWMCDDCFFTSASQLTATLHWSCQGLSVEAIAANTDGSTRVLSTFAWANPTDGFLSSVHLTYATLLVVQDDKRGQYRRDVTDRSGLGYQLISQLREVRYAPLKPQGFLPNQDSVALEVDFPLEALYAKVSLTDAQSPFDLISALTGLGGFFGAFGVAFALLEPVLVKSKWWRKMFGDTSAHEAIHSSYHALSPEAGEAPTGTPADGSESPGTAGAGGTPAPGATSDGDGERREGTNPTVPGHAAGPAGVRSMSLRVNPVGALGRDHPGSSTSDEAFQAVPIPMLPLAMPLPTEVESRVRTSPMGTGGEYADMSEPRTPPKDGEATGAAGTRVLIL